MPCKELGSWWQRWSCSLQPWWWEYFSAHIDKHIGDRKFQEASRHDPQHRDLGWQHFGNHNDWNNNQINAGNNWNINALSTF